MRTSRLGDLGAWTRTIFEQIGDAERGPDVNDL